jgi:pimeloyl-ACP methyl ester carboxylesterase
VVERAPAEHRELLEIPVGRARLAVARRGADGPPHVVFLHTGISDLRSWDEVSDLLSPDMDVVAYDRRGFGVTAYRPERHDQVVDLLAVLDGLGLDEVVLVGNSRGGQHWSWSPRLSPARPRPARSSRSKPQYGRPSKRRRPRGLSMPSISVRSACGSTGRTLPRGGSAARSGTSPST